MPKEVKTEKTNAMRLLDAAGISYSSYSYDTADGKIDGVSVAGKIGIPVEQVFKTLVTVGASGAFYVFIIPVACELDLKKAAAAAEEKNIVMCPSKDLLKNTGYIHGGCSPVGMKKLFPTYLDENAILLDTIVFSAGKIGAQIACAPDDLISIIKGAYADLCK